MKIATILGTRPEIIKLSRVIAKLDQLSDHTLIHTGQNYDKKLNDIFFQELGIREPDIILESKDNSSIGQISKILSGVEKILIDKKIDRVLILGDTNSGLSAIVAKKLGIPVFHMEAGNRCYSDKVPEEVNRRVIDTVSDVLMPYTNRSKEILYGEGYPKNKIFTVGNPIYEVLEYYSGKINKSSILTDLKLEKGEYILVTLHRTENVDDSDRLSRYIDAISMLHQEYQIPVVFSIHPRTKDQMNRQGIVLPEKGVIDLEPLGFFDFVKLEQNAFCVVSDSGTPQEECSIYGVPNVLLRDVTERHETIDAGSNYIAGSYPEHILLGVKVATTLKDNWVVPAEYHKKNVSDTVARIIVSHWEI